MTSHNLGVFIANNLSNYTIENRYITDFLLDVMMGEEPWLDAAGFCAIMNRVPLTTDMDLPSLGIPQSEVIIINNMVPTYYNTDEKLTFHIPVDIREPWPSGNTLAW